jgi:Uma2 family endonuclease
VSHRLAFRKLQEPEPTWDIAHLFPAQGTWSEDDYLALNTNRLLELANGRLEVLPMPTTLHQILVLYLYGLLNAHVSAGGLGMVLVAPLRVRLWPGKFREPDVVFMLKDHFDRVGNKYWKGADLVLEVVSDDAEDRQRDLVDKRADYARAGIREYWIVDPQDAQITVLRLSGKRYLIHGEFGKGTAAASHLLPGFSVNVSDTFAQRLPTSPASKAGRRSRK